MNKLSFIITASIIFILVGCGQKHSNESNTAQRYTVHPVNDHYAIIIDQHAGKFVKVGFSNSSWNETPTELNIDWNETDSVKENRIEPCLECMGEGHIPCPACKYTSNSSACPRCSSTESEGTIQCDKCKGTGTVETQ